MTLFVTVRNLAPTVLRLKRIEAFEDPGTKQSRAGYFSFVSRNITSSAPSAPELGEHAQSFNHQDLSIELSPFESTTLTAKNLQARDQNASTLSSTTLRLTVEASQGEKYRVDVNPTYTQKGSQTLVPLTPNPSGSYTALYHPAHPIPHLTIHANDVRDYSKWMSDLPSSLPLSAISVPGSHNSHTWHRALPSVRCQIVPVKEQLQNGIRFLDIRVQPSHATDLGKKELHLVHGAFPASLTGAKYLEPIIETCYEFLEHCPGETIFVCLKREGIGSSTDEHLSQILEQHYIGANKDRWYTGSRLPYLGDARGKLVLVRRYHLHESLKASSEDHGYGLDATAWPDNSAHAVHGCFCVQDFYEVLEPTLIPKKLQYSNEHLVRSAECTAFVPGVNTDKTNPVPSGPLYLNFLSASNFFRMSCWPDKIAKVINRGIEEWICMGHHLEEPLITPAEPSKTSFEVQASKANDTVQAVRRAKKGDGCTGVVIMDNVGEAGDWDLVKMIIGMNMGVKMRIGDIETV